MKNARQLFAPLLMCLALCISSAQATIIDFTTTQLSSTRWRYDYTIHNDTLGKPLEEFTIFFREDLFANLSNESSLAADCDLILIQPSTGIPAAGFIDGISFSGGIAAKGTLSGIAVSFDYLGTAAPGRQQFSVIDPASFTELDAGLTGISAAMPLPGTLSLFALGLLAVVLQSAQRRRAPQMRSSFGRLLGSVGLAFLVASCGDNSGHPDHNTAPTLLTAKVSQSAPVPAMIAAAQFEVTAIQKIAEARISRTVFEYSYQISIRNNGSSGAANVKAMLSSAPASATIIDGQVDAGSIAAGASVTPKDPVVLRIDRALPFNQTELAWNIRSSSVLQLEAVKPAEVVVLSLADLGLPNGADKVSVTGAVNDVLLKQGTLRFSTPGDTGVPQHAEFTLLSAGVATVLSLPISTERPTEPLVHLEPLDDGATPGSVPTLAIKGLGPNNSFSGNTLTFKLDGMEPMDLKDDSDGLVSTADNNNVRLKNYWTFNPADNSFTIGGLQLQQLLAALPKGALTLSLNFVSKDGTFAVSYELLAIHQSATIAGKVITPQGAPVTSLAGKKILLRGFNQRLRQVATVDGNGGFNFTNVIPDTYQLTLNDLDNPNVVSVSTIVLQNTTTANVSITYNLGTAPKAMLAAPSASFMASSVRQDGAAPKARDLPQGARTLGAPAPLSLAGGAATFSATAAAKNATITTPISFDVPRGTKNVGVKITVSTAEYPVYTTQQSQFNDTWSYAVTGLPGTSLSASGSVNQSHFTQGTISKTACVDVTTQAKDSPLTVCGAVSATNIGDSQLATVTQVELSTACVALSVTEAKFLTPNKDEHPVLQPTKLQANLTGPYLSVQLNGTDATHTVPMEIKYSPADAKITEVNISVSANGGSPAFSNENLLGQSHTDLNGKIRFSGISLPAFVGANTAGKVAVTVRLKGKVQDTEVTSDPQEGGQVALNGENAFIPLYLANNASGLGARRYGTRDAGGDSWATPQTVTWLQSRVYRFDDISGQHITQTEAGRSILDHSGHSDGQQIDLRYADGAGGFTDALGGQSNGAAIQQMFNAARQEVIGNAATKPQLAALRAWITANRALLDAEAPAASTRVIFIGPSFIKLALVDGLFSVSPNVAIPGVPAWTKPARVQIDAAHLSHWHLSMTAHP